MSNLESDYKKCKVKLKIWEDEFKKRNGRAPSKNDIKEAPNDIRSYYKYYWNLKIKILENKYLDNEPGEKSLKKCNFETEIRLEKEDKLTNTAKDKNVNLEIKTLEESCDVKKQVVNTENVWGVHLNKEIVPDTQIKPNKLLETKSFQISNKLFSGSSFKMRNPRKSFTKTKSNVETKSTIENENLFIQNNFDSELSLLSVSDLTETNFSVEDNCSPKVKELISANISLSPFLKQNYCQSKSEIKPQSVSLIPTTCSSNNVKTLKSARRLDVGWLNRVNTATTVDFKEMRSSDSGFNSSFDLSSLNLPDKSDSKSQNKIEPMVDEEDDLDIIGDSDTETSQTTYPKKRKFHEITNVSQNNDHVMKRTKLDTKERAIKHVYEFKNDEKVDVKQKNKKLSKKEILEKKIQNGTVNDNFVKINIKKKVFVRGKRNFNYSKFKKQKWKNKMKDTSEPSIVKCYKCGDIGHYAKYCQTILNDKLLKNNDECDDEQDLDHLDYPTLEEAALMAENVPVTSDVKELDTIEGDMYFKDDLLVNLTLPVLTTNMNETFSEVYSVLNKFGHKNFRPGQEEAVIRILRGQSTLVTLATGTGKSLCYQLPSYMYAVKYGYLTLVVSPLVSLMEDQVAGSSSFYKVACLHTNQTEKQREVVLNQVKSGTLHALLVSPETIVIGEKSSGFNSLLRLLPKIAFACIDEAHCLSQWSHNFRSSYLLVCQILRDKLGIKTFLGLTATASEQTISSIKEQLGMPGDSDEGVIKDTPLPDNLILSVSADKNKDKSLLEMLQTPPYSESASTLIYCTRRDECERLAVMIRTLIRQDNVTNKRISTHAEAYHAGMSSAKRKQVQKLFMSGKLKIVVATVAFGMGINKPDIRSVVHYNMPKNFESYVQEVGRAGRDGLPANCHVFLDTQGGDLCELKRHVYSDSVDRHVVRKLLERVFVPCDCVSICRTHEISFDMNTTIQQLDLPEENILTLLYYLELQGDVTVLPPTYTTCRITSYRGSNVLKLMSKKCPPLAMALALEQDRGKDSLVFNVVQLADRIKWKSGKVKKWLKNLEWKKDPSDKWKKTGVSVEFSSLGFHVQSKCLLTTGQLDTALEKLYTRVNNQETTCLNNLYNLYGALKSVARPTFVDCVEGVDKEERSHRLKDLVRKYFVDGSLNLEEDCRFQADDFQEDEVISDVRSLINNYRDHNFNGRAVARILHGIQSPNYPASVWYKCKLWRSHVNKNFNKLSKIATKEILKLR